MLYRRWRRDGFLLLHQRVFQNIFQVVREPAYAVKAQDVATALERVGRAHRLLHHGLGANPRTPGAHSKLNLFKLPWRIEQKHL